MGSCIGYKGKKHGNIQPIPVVPYVQKKNNDSNCPICYDTLTDGVTRQTNCGCFLHEDCFKLLLQNAVSSKSYPIKCPYSSCARKIDLLSLSEFLNGDDIVPLLDLAFLYYTLDDENEIIRCPRQCGYAISWDPESKCKGFDCLICEVQFCSQCFKESHEDHCEKIPSSFKRCKMCSNLIERYEGCDNVTCRCGYQFCWKCKTDNR